MMEDQPYVKRDISWLYFNQRVLQEAKDERAPLYERIKFLAIYSSNLDEYFRVRVASLRSFKMLKKETRREMDIKPKKELRQIRKIVQEQQSEFGRIFRKEILPQLKEKGVHLINEKEYDTTQQAFARNYYDEQLRQRLQPLFIEADGHAPFLKNKGLYFVTQFEEAEGLALIPIPSGELPRFVTLPSTQADQYYLTFLDDILRYNLDRLFAKKISGVYAVKLSRDAEMYIEDEFHGDLVEKIKAGLEDRNVGLPTRFLYDSRMPKALLQQLKNLFQLKKPDLIPGARYHNFNDFFDFPDPSDSPELHYQAMPPLPHPVLETAGSITAAIGKQDQLLHFPYQRYGYVPQWIWEAAEDPQVQSIRITLYRVASDSEVVNALLHALKKGKAVTAFIEAKARFDESSNIFWGEQLEQAGGKVLYSYPEIKVHTKLLLIGRQEEDKTRHYAYIGTGNFNEKTARIYCDHAILTADASLADEVERIFDLLERKVILPQCRRLLVSPFTLRDRFGEMIDREIEYARAGEEAYLILKMNALEDPEMIHKLYKASRAGVRIRIIVRGVCCLVPGVEGWSENIEVISILDRFLEHARVYIFGNRGTEEMYLASADWMTRNLDRRVEVAAPVRDPRVFREIRNIIDMQLKDNTKARLIEASQSNPYRERQAGEAPVRAQYDSYAYLEGLLEPRRHQKKAERSKDV